MRKKSIAMTLAAVAAAAVMTLSACAGAATGTSESNGKPQAGGDITIARSADVVSLLPTAVGDNPSIWTQELLYEPLLKPKPDGSGVQPWLAKSYTVSKDLKTWTLKLQQGVKFSDGSTMTSKDVKWSLERASQKDAQYESYNEPISAIAIPDDSTVVITLKQAWAPFAATLALFSNAIIPANYGGKSADQFNKRPVGTGPFTLGSWVKGQYIKLLKNKHYWQKGKPYLNSVTFTTVNDATTRLTQVKSGEIDVDEAPAYSSMAAIKSAGGDLKVGDWKSGHTDYLTMNNTYGPLKDVHVRRAISYAIDRKAIVSNVLYGYGEAATSYMPTNIWSHIDAGEKYDMAKAKKELAQSGKYAKGFSVELLTESGNDDHKAVAQIIQASLKKLNIDVTIKTTDPTTIEDTESSGEFQMGFVYRTPDVIDPDQFIRYSDGRRTSHALYSNYMNTALSPMYENGAAQASKADREKIYAQIQKIATNDAFVATLYYSPSTAILSSKVHGYSTGSVGEYSMADTWIEH
jgi:peptide/nickel transport system substrate-binding protein